MPASTKVTTSFDRYENPRIALPLKMVTPFRRGIMTAWIILADLVSLIFAGWLSISIRSWRICFKFPWKSFKKEVPDELYS